MTTVNLLPIMFHCFTCERGAALQLTEGNFHRCLFCCVTSLWILDCFSLLYYFTLGWVENPIPSSPAVLKALRGKEGDPHSFDVCKPAASSLNFLVCRFWTWNTYQCSKCFSPSCLPKGRVVKLSRKITASLWLWSFPKLVSQCDPYSWARGTELFLSCSTFPLVMVKVKNFWPIACGVNKL